MEVEAPADSDLTCDPDSLVGQVEKMAEIVVKPTAISFDQLVSGRIPLDKPTKDPKEFVAIVCFDDDKLEWHPHVCHPLSGMMVPTACGGAMHSGKLIRNKCTKEKRTDRLKAALNVTQRTMKSEGSKQQTWSRCRIFWLCKDGKPPAA